MYALIGGLYLGWALGANNAGLHAVLLDPGERMDFPVDRLRDVGALPGYMDRLST